MKYFLYILLILYTLTRLCIYCPWDGTPGWRVAPNKYTCIYAHVWECNL